MTDRRIVARRVYIMNIDYSQFYKGTMNIPSYGNGTYKKDTLVKYEFNTTDEHGNKVISGFVKQIANANAVTDNVGSTFNDTI